jgi:hypothetical protein
MVECLWKDSFPFPANEDTKKAAGKALMAACG